MGKSRNRNINANKRTNIGKLVKQRRIAIQLTLRELSTRSGVSISHLARIEEGNRFPSARILHKIATPLNFEESELFTLAGYLSPRSRGKTKIEPDYVTPGLDSHVAKLLAQEPLEVQRTIITILNTLKSIARSVTKENR